MAVSDKSIDPRLLESAKSEFLAKGYVDASIVEICKNAGITTGALYKRYKNKEDLFDATVKETLCAIESVMVDKRNVSLYEMSDEDLIGAWQMDEEYMMWWFNFLYSKRDGMVLLLRCSDGTKHSNFQHEFVEKMMETTYAYYLEARKRGICDADISKKELHILLSAFWTTIYEPFIHEYTFKEIERYCPLLCRLFDWNTTLKFKTEMIT